MKRAQPLSLKNNSEVRLAKLEVGTPGQGAEIDHRQLSPSRRLPRTGASTGAENLCGTVLVTRQLTTACRRDGGARHSVADANDDGGFLPARVLNVAFYHDHSSKRGVIQEDLSRNDSSRRQLRVM